MGNRIHKSSSCVLCRILRHLETRERYSQGRSTLCSNFAIEGIFHANRHAVPQWSSALGGLVVVFQTHRLTDPEVVKRSHSKCILKYEPVKARKIELSLEMPLKKIVVCEAMNFFEKASKN
ncbi:hypothetical protein TNCT_337192 [Trichonephila clavata]|uniref:Uncharacterized protein n=1 Tax=Trichonephila clavata TaxID=2740835 RepID=A0A8X6ID31_TRICU|nr:hypothetical protein TNCT_337192 [Trichonephila clavata]